MREIFIGMRLASADRIVRVSKANRLEEVFMRSRVLVGLLVIIGLLAVGTIAASDVGATPSRQWIVATFTRPTIIAGAIVSGPVVIVHDEGKMTSGEPCTTVYRFDTKNGRQEQIVSFMCKPVERRAVDKFTVTCNRAVLSGPDVLVEYQFSGDKEAHGVPAYDR
jgi:hypothetical protein